MVICFNVREGFLFGYQQRAGFTPPSTDQILLRCLDLGTREQNKGDSFSGGTVRNILLHLNVRNVTQTL